MRRLIVAKVKAQNAQDTSSKEELVAMQIDTADVMRTCPVCTTPQEGDFEECGCGEMLGCLSCAADTQQECDSCGQRGCDECMSDVERNNREDHAAAMQANAADAKRTCLICNAPQNEASECDCLTGK